MEAIFVCLATVFDIKTLRKAPQRARQFTQLLFFPLFSPCESLSFFPFLPCAVDSQTPLGQPSHLCYLLELTGAPFTRATGTFQVPTKCAYLAGGSRTSRLKKAPTPRCLTRRRPRVRLNEKGYFDPTDDQLFTVSEVLDDKGHPFLVLRLISFIQRAQL